MIDIKKWVRNGIIIGIVLLLPGLKAKAKELHFDNKSTNYLNELNGRISLSDDIYNILSSNTYKEIFNEGSIKENVNLREYPSTSSDKLEVIKAGEVVSLYYLVNDWYLANYHDQIGFLKSKYVREIDWNKISEQVDNMPEIHLGIEALDDVNIRKLPSKDSKKIGILKKGLKTVFIDKKNDYYEIMYGDEVGYINSNYVKEFYYIVGNIEEIIYVKGDTFAYNYPYGEQIGIMPKYEVGYVYGKVADYYLIESHGKVGYIKKSDCEILDNDFAIVDIGSQTITVYKDNEFVFDSAIVSGKDSTPTKLGFYYFENKYPNKKFEGGKVSKYWLSFNHGQGCHDAPWRTKFGGSIYHKNGSNGCVNLPDDSAEKLYNTMDVGDKILIKK